MPIQGPLPSFARTAALENAKDTGDPSFQYTLPLEKVPSPAGIVKAKCTMLDDFRTSVF